MKWSDLKRASDTILAVWPHYRPLHERWFMQELVDKGELAPIWRERLVPGDNDAVFADYFPDGARDPRLSRRTLWHRRVARSGSRPSPTPSWRKLANGRTGRSTPSIRSSSSTPSGSRSGTRASCATRAKFWLRVMNELKNRGVGDILIAAVDGLKGFPEAISAAFPQTVVQTCIVHLIRHSLEFV